MLAELTDSQFSALQSAMLREEMRRREAKFKEQNKCPDCGGTGYTGGEGDHFPCYRCKTTGEYTQTP